MKLFNSVIAYFLFMGILIGQDKFFTLDDHAKLYLQEFSLQESQLLDFNHTRKIFSHMHHKNAAKSLLQG